MCVSISYGLIMFPTGSRGNKIKSYIVLHGLVVKSAQLSIQFNSIQFNSCMYVITQFIGKVL